MKFRRSVKKLSAAIMTGIIGMTLTLPTLPPPTAEAIGIGSAIGVGIGAVTLAQQRQAVKKQLELYNNTQEGQDELYKAFREKYGVNNDYNLNAKLSTIMTNLTNAVAQVDPTITEKPYKYFISNENTINAACGMGHVMMVNKGTFDKILVEDEIAAVVGHEMGHGQKDHVLKGTMKSIDRQIVTQLGVTAAGGSLLTNLAGKIILIQANAHATKSNEWEADNLAFEYMQHTNYNLGACAAIMQRFVEIMGSQKQKKADMILNPSDHPNSEARRDNYAKKLYEYSNGHASAEGGVVMVNSMIFTTPAETSTMSTHERSYFILGNLAAAFHNGQDTADARAEGNTVYLGSQPIITTVDGDESAQDLAERLNSIK